MGASQQHKVDNQPLVTLLFWDISFSHSYASISRKSRLVTIRQLSIHGNVEMSFWWPDVLPEANQEEMLESGNLFSSSWILPLYHKH